MSSSEMLDETDGRTGFAPSIANSSQSCNGFGGSNHAVTAAGVSVGRGTDESNGMGSFSDKSTDGTVLTGGYVEVTTSGEAKIGSMLLESGMMGSNWGAGTSDVNDGLSISSCVAKSPFIGVCGSDARGDGEKTVFDIVELT